MKLWKNLSNRLDAVADVMAAKPCMQGCVGKTLLSIPRTPGNLITAVILAIGLLITIGRFGFGLGAVTNLDDNNPWGIWIAFDLLCGVALAAGGYVTSSACYLFGMKRYHSAVRPAILTAFLGYAFVVVALLYDVGQPWRLPYPLLVSQGTTSLLFEVGLCVGIYLTVLFIEWSPVGLEWLLGMKDAPCWLVRLRPRMHTIRKAVLCFTIPLTILGVVLSTMHQSSLGALFLIAPSKMHPLWYSPFMPVFFFISSMVAGLSMVIFEGTLSHKALHNKMDETHLREADGVVFGFGRAATSSSRCWTPPWTTTGTISLPVTVRGSPSKWSASCSCPPSCTPSACAKRTSRSFVWRRCSACSASSSTASTCASWPSTGSWTARIATSRASRKCSCPSLS